MNKSKSLKSKKGSSLIIVFIICTVIGILLATTFIITGNYSRSILQRRSSLQKEVCLQCYLDEVAEEAEESEESEELEEPSEEEEPAE